MNWILAFVLSAGVAHAADLPDRCASQLMVHIERPEAHFQPWSKFAAELNPRESATVILRLPFSHLDGTPLMRFQDFPLSEGLTVLNQFSLAHHPSVYLVAEGHATAWRELEFPDDVEFEFLQSKFAPTQLRVPSPHDQFIEVRSGADPREAESVIQSVTRPAVVFDVSSAKTYFVYPSKSLPALSRERLESLGIATSSLKDGLLSHLREQALNTAAFEFLWHDSRVLSASAYVQMRKLDGQKITATDAEKPPPEIEALLRECRETICVIKAEPVTEEFVQHELPSDVARPKYGNVILAELRLLHGGTLKNQDGMVAEMVHVMDILLGRKKAQNVRAKILGDLAPTDYKNVIRLPSTNRIVNVFKEIAKQGKLEWDDTDPIHAAVLVIQRAVSQQTIIKEKPPAGPPSEPVSSVNLDGYHFSEPAFVPPLVAEYVRVTGTLDLKMGFESILAALPASPESNQDLKDLVAEMSHDEAQAVLTKPRAQARLARVLQLLGAPFGVPINNEPRPDQVYSLFVALGEKFNPINGQLLRAQTEFAFHQEPGKIKRGSWRDAFVKVFPRVMDSVVRPANNNDLDATFDGTSLVDLRRVLKVVGRQTFPEVDEAEDFLVLDLLHERRVENAIEAEKPRKASKYDGALVKLYGSGTELFELSDKIQNELRARNVSPNSIARMRIHDSTLILHPAEQNTDGIDWTMLFGTDTAQPALISNGRVAQLMRYTSSQEDHFCDEIAHKFKVQPYLGSIALGLIGIEPKVRARIFLKRGLDAIEERLNEMEVTSRTKGKSGREIWQTNGPKGWRYEIKGRREGNAFYLDDVRVL